MVGFGGDKEEEPSDELNVGLRGERAVDAGVWLRRLSIWVNGEGRDRREMCGFSLEPVTFAMTGLVFRDVLHCGAALPTPMLGDLQFKGP